MTKVNLGYLNPIKRFFKSQQLLDLKDPGADYLI